MVKNFVDRHAVQIIVIIGFCSILLSFLTYTGEMESKANFSAYEAEKAAWDKKSERVEILAEQKNQEYLKERQRR